MKARLFVLPIVAVTVLYVLVSMAAALARFPGSEIDGTGGYGHHFAATVVDSEEADEMRTEHVIP
jgi:hypothetical protein